MPLTVPRPAAYSLFTWKHLKALGRHIMTMGWINLFLLIFFGVAIVVGVWFGWVLLRNEMRGRPKPPPDPYDFGFGPPHPDGKSNH
jgi:hypothetical protein